MEEEKRKRQLGKNMVSLRKRYGMTQAMLAQKLNYSDKAVSKWERGESMPDLLTLMQIAELFGTTTDELLKDPNALPENTGRVEKAMEKAVEKTLKRKADKGTILILCSMLTLFVATLAFVITSTLALPYGWLAFLYAIPADAIVLLSLLSAWHDFRWNQTLASVILWGSISSIYLSLLLFAGKNIWSVFLLGIPSQAALIFWLRMLCKMPKEKTGNG